jgi:hypothetical protein
VGKREQEGGNRRGEHHRHEYQAAAIAIGPYPERHPEKRPGQDRGCDQQAEFCFVEAELPFDADANDREDCPDSKARGEGQCASVIGRHPVAHIQLEAYKLGLFHIVLRKKDDRLYVEAIDEDYGTLLNRKKIQAGQSVLLWDGSLVDIPGYRLRFCLASAPLTGRKKPSMRRNWRKSLPFSIIRLPLPRVRC